MADRFASSQNALGICDVCGFSYRLRELKNLIEKGRNTNIKACPECWSPDHPQLRLGEYPVNDPQALRDPRPDFAELAESRGIQFGWDPVGLDNPFSLTPNDLIGTAHLGSVTVTTG